MEDQGMLNRFKSLFQNSDITVAAGAFMIIVVLIIPIPPIILDGLLSLVLAFSIMILLLSIYSKRPLDFSTFPTVLLMMTLFRLSLNVATTKNILLRGGTEGTLAAGQIIKSFGEFIVEGNYIVGIIVFIILVVINFMVITKGAGRSAEVAARFTLDAMPGKQMAIDADLNAGLIKESEAKRRREEIAEEADFYGSMDGASKFVRGDAIAGILIAIINIIGGILNGMVKNNMSFEEATQTFTLLTIGDGLVSQIPALIISTAAGIIITRSNVSDELGEQVKNQVKLQPKAVLITSFSLLFIGVIPGMPAGPFWLVGIFGLGLSYYMEKKREEELLTGSQVEAEEKKVTSDNLEGLLDLEMVELEVGYGLVGLVDSDQDGDLLERITHIRKQFVLDWGIIVPSIKIKDNLDLKPAGYVIKIKGVPVATGELIPDCFLAMDPGTVVDKIEGTQTVEPVFGLNAVWITEEQKEDAQYNGYTVVDLSTVLATHLTEILKSNLHELIGRQELVGILDNFKETHPKLVGDLIPDILTLGQVLKTVQNLLRERVSVRDLRSILETLAEHGATIKDTEVLTELVRQSLYRTITEGIKSEKGDIPLFTLDRTIEEHISKGLVDTDRGQQVSVDPKITQNILAGINQKMEEATDMGEKMVILCHPTVRNHFKRLTEKFLPGLVVVSHEELAPEINIRSLGTVRL